MPAGAAASWCSERQARCAPSHGLWHGYLRLCVFSLLTIGQHARAVNLRRSDVSSNGTSLSHATPDNQKGHAQPGDYFLLQYVGYEEFPVELPNTPHDAKARCLTVGNSLTTAGGQDLYWDVCESEIALVQINVQKMHAQSFKFNDDGTISDRTHGRCLRRMPCKEHGKDVQVLVYDLADCHDEDVYKFEVQKLQANSMKKDFERDLGSLHKAVDIELCALTKLCGPWRLKHHRRQGSYQAQPGWTKGASQYVGIDAIMGRSQYGKEVAAEAKLQETFGVDFSGVGEIVDKDGYCGTHTADTQTKGSIFYVLLSDDSYSALNRQTSLDVHMTVVNAG